MSKRQARRYKGDPFPSRAYAVRHENTDEPAYSEYWDCAGIGGMNRLDGPAQWVATYKLISVRRVRVISKTVAK